MAFIRRHAGVLLASRPSVTASSSSSSSLTHAKLHTLAKSQGYAVTAVAAPSSQLLRPPPPFPPRRYCNQHSSFHTSTRSLQSDDPGGKANDGSHPTVYDDFYNLLDPNDPDQTPSLTIESITPERVTLSDGLVVTSGLIVVNGSCFLWDAPELHVEKALPSGVGWEEWLERIEEVWKLLEVIEPKPEVLLFGTGSRVLPLPTEIRSHLAGLGIQVDVQSSQNAASTFNVLAEEGRKVACALIPANRSPLKQPKGTGEDVQGEARRAIRDAGTSSIASTRTFSTSTRANATSSSSSSSPTTTTTNNNNNNDNTSSSPFTPTLQHFILHSSVLSLYRRLLRSTRPIPNPAARRETIAWYRSEFERERHQTDLRAIRDLLAQGARTIKILEGSVALGDVDRVGVGKGRGLRGIRTS